MYVGIYLKTRRKHGFLGSSFPHDGLSTAEAGARHQHSPAGTDGCWCLAPRTQHTAKR